MLPAKMLSGFTLAGPPCIVYRAELPVTDNAYRYIVNIRESALHMLDYKIHKNLPTV